MANRYGEAALLAVRMETYGKALSSLERWDQAIKQLYPTSPIAQRKGGPRAAFLSLCEAGLVKGIAASRYAPPNQHTDYAARAVSLLAAGTHKSVNELWSEVTEGRDTPHSNQMDVVLALWKNGLILSRA